MSLAQGEDMKHGTLIRKAIKYQTLNRIELFTGQFLGALDSLDNGDPERTQTIENVKKKFKEDVDAHIRKLRSYSDVEDAANKSYFDLTEVENIFRRTVANVFSRSEEHQLLYEHPISKNFSLQAWAFREWCQQLNRGLCFGLAVCHGAMDLDEVDSVKEWNSKLDTLNDWDESLASITVQGQATPTNTIQDQKAGAVETKNDANQSSDPAVALRKTFDDVFDGLVVAQDTLPHNVTETRSSILQQSMGFEAKHDQNTTPNSDFRLKGMETRNFLRPDAYVFEDRNKQQLNKSFFEISVRNKETGKREVRTIKSHKVIAGYFDNLADYLDVGTIQNSICIISRANDPHAIRLGYKDLPQPHWILYDSGETYEESLDNVCKKIHEKMGHDLRIEVAAITTRTLSFPNYMTRLRSVEGSVQLLKGAGLHMMASFTPDILKKELLDPEIKLTDDQIKVIADALTHQPVSGNLKQLSGFGYLVDQTPSVLDRLFQLAATNTNIKDSIAKAIVLDKSLASEDYKALKPFYPELLKFKLTSLDDELNLKEAVLRQYKPEQLDQEVEALFSSPDSTDRDYLLTLAKRDKDNENAFLRNAVLRHLHGSDSRLNNIATTRHLESCLVIAALNNDWDTAIKLIHAKKDNNAAIINFFKNLNPVTVIPSWAISDFLKLAEEVNNGFEQKQDKNLKEAIILGMERAGKKVITGIRQLVQSGNVQLNAVVEYAPQAIASFLNENETEFEKFLSPLKSGDYGLSKIVKADPQCLPALCSLAGKKPSEQFKASLGQAILATTSDVTGLTDTLTALASSSNQGNGTVWHQLSKQGDVYKELVRDAIISNISKISTNELIPLGVRLIRASYKNSFDSYRGLFREQGPHGLFGIFESYGRTGISQDILRSIKATLATRATEVITYKTAHGSQQQDLEDLKALQDYKCGRYGMY